MTPDTDGLSADSRAAAEERACRENVAAGWLRQAARHLGQALFHDPALASVYAALGEVAKAAGSADAARELFKGDGTTVFLGNAAAITTLIAEEGRVPDAVELARIPGRRPSREALSRRGPGSAQSRPPPYR